MKKLFTLLTLMAASYASLAQCTFTPVITPLSYNNFCTGQDYTLTVSPTKNNWTQKSSNAIMSVRWQCGSFSIGTKGYFVAGADGNAARSDTWEYDAVNDTWSQKANFLGGVRTHVVAFSIGAKGYAGTGQVANGNNDFYSYDPATNTWTALNNVPGLPRYKATGFAAGGKGYVGLGRSGGNDLYDFYEFDPTNNSWTAKANYPGNGVWSNTGLGINGKPYVGLGFNFNGNAQLDMWELDPVANTWTQKASHSSNIFAESVGFSIGNKGYIGTGYNVNYMNAFWEFDPLANTWTQRANFGGTARRGAAGFVINGTGYIGMGLSNLSDGTFKKDLWEYTPASVTYSWSTGSTLQAVSASVTANYTVTVTDALGCSSTVTTNIVVGTTPTIGINSGTVCAGKNFTLVPTGGITTFTYNGGFTQSVVIVNQTSAYTLTGRNAAGCLSANSAVANVTAVPIPTVSASGGTICVGKVFTITPSGADTYSITGNSFTVNPTVNNGYFITGTSTLTGCVSSAFATYADITVYGPPSIVANSGAICQGGSYTISPSTNAVTYTISGGTFTVSPTTTTAYSITGTTSRGCISSTPAIVNVTVNPSPTVSVNSGTICSGQSFTLIPANASTYTITGGTATVTPQTTTTYSVTGKSAAGCISSNTAVATVSVSATPVISATGGTVCSGQQFVINYSGANTYTINGNTFTVSPTANTSYSVTGTSTNGCTSTVSAVANVTVAALPLITSNNGSICAGQVFTATPGGGVSYTVNASPGFTLSPAANTSYSVTGTGTNGCVSSTITVATISVYALPVISVNSGSVCSGTAFTINPTGANTYSITGNTFIVSPTVNTSYSVTGTSSVGCASQTNAIASVSVYALPVISVNSGSVCAGNVFVINPSGASSYSVTGNSFTVTPNSTASYSVTGTSSVGCASSNTAIASVSVYALPFVSVNSGSVCSGSPFTIIPAGAGIYTISGNTFTVSPTATSSYSVNGIDALGCASSNTAVATITVVALPALTAGSSQPTICAGGSAVLNAGGNSNFYSWNTGAANASITVSPGTTTSYTVTGIAATGCSNTAVVQQVVDPCTGIRLQETNAGLLVYPNPNNGGFNVQIPSFTENTTLEIYASTGQLIYSLPAESENTVLTIKNHAAGIYFLRVSQNGKIIKEEKIIKSE